VVPPHTPQSCPVSRAKLRHSARTWQRAQTAFAAVIWRVAGPDEVMGKKRSGSTSRQAPRDAQSAVIVLPVVDTDMIISSDLSGRCGS
jgi:hypothetical protein